MSIPGNDSPTSLSSSSAPSAASFTSSGPSTSSPFSGTASPLGQAGDDVSTSSLLSGFVAKGGKQMQLMGWVFIVLSFPLMLVLVGFFFLPMGIWMVWYGKKLGRNAHQTSSKVTAGMAAVGRTFRGRD